MLLQDSGSSGSNDSCVTQSLLPHRRRRIPVAVLWRAVRQQLRQPRSAAAVGVNHADPVPTEYGDSDAVDGGRQPAADAGQRWTESARNDDDGGGGGGADDGDVQRGQRSVEFVCERSLRRRSAAAATRRFRHCQVRVEADCTTRSSPAVPLHWHLRQLDQLTNQAKKLICVS